MAREIAMTIEQLILSQAGAGVGLAVAYYWIKALQKTLDDTIKLHKEEMVHQADVHKEEMQCQADSHNNEVIRLQERMDRMQERQNELFHRALNKTDLKDTDH